MELRAIKGKIKAVGKTRQVTRAMEAVSAAKMRKSQERALSARPYAISAFRLLKRVSASNEAREIKLLSASASGPDTAAPKGKVLFVVITSDRGLAGSLNSSVLRKISAFLKEKNLSKDDVAFATTGRKGYEYFSKRGYTITHNFEKLGDAPVISIVETVSAHAFELFKSGAYSNVYVAYSNFISTFSQEPKLHQGLPLQIDEVKEVIQGIVPIKGKYSELFHIDEESDPKGVSYLFEPSPGAILERLIFDLFTVLIYHGILEARASEFSARMVAMRSASDKALEMGNALTLEYNKARQSTITREVSEIVGGVEALAA